MPKAIGAYRILFDTTGRAKGVQMLRSCGAAIARSVGHQCFVAVEVRSRHGMEPGRAGQFSGNSETLMPEMANAGEDHRHVALVGGGDDFFVAN